MTTDIVVINTRPYDSIWAKWVASAALRVEEYDTIRVYGNPHASVTERWIRVVKYGRTRGRAFKKAQRKIDKIVAFDRAVLAERERSRKLRERTVYTPNA